MSALFVVFVASRNRTKLVRPDEEVKRGGHQGENDERKDDIKHESISLESLAKHRESDTARITNSANIFPAAGRSCNYLGLGRRVHSVEKA
jgi:hypothetical protein